MFISESGARREKAKQSEVVLRGISRVQSQRSEVNESKGAGVKMINPLESKVRPDVTCRRPSAMAVLRRRKRLLIAPAF
jgi:hypothetical protein